MSTITQDRVEGIIRQYLEHRRELIRALRLVCNNPQALKQLTSHQVGYIRKVLNYMPEEGQEARLPSDI